MIRGLKKAQKGFFFLWILVLFFSIGKLQAQSCDPNILKALEQTRITTFEQVTQGEVGEFVVRYPLAGTTYTLTDQSGAVYSKTYTGTPPEITLHISVGNVTTPRSFSLKAQNGACSYSTAFNYTITPQTTPAISVRVEHEWCNDAAGIYFQMIGANTNDYDFYMKKSTEASYDFSAIKRLAYSGAQTLKASTYDLVAVLKTDHSQKIEHKNIKVEKQVEPIVFTAQYIPSLCPTVLPKVKVNVTSGKYPLYFSLYDKTFHHVIKPKQTSNIFTDVPPGEYRVLVENFCAVGGGAQTPQPVVVENYLFSLQAIQRFFPFEHSCNYASFREIEFTSDNIQHIWEMDAFPYPFEIKLNFTSPASRTYTVSKTISNRTDLENAFYISNGAGNKTLYWKESIYQNIPLEYGNWTMQAQLITCGTTKTLPIVTKPLLDPMENVVTQLSTEATCNPNKILVGMRNIGESRDYPVYMVLEEYPNTFNPDAAGFYKIATTNPKLANKYVKKFDTLVNHYELVPAGNLRAGDKFRFRAVSVDCSKDRLLDELTIPTSAILTSETYFWQTASCKSTPTGSRFANIIIANKQYTNNIKEVKLTAFSGDNTLLPVTLPYIFTNRNTSGIQQEWQVNDMPVGTYTYQYTDICGNTYTATGELIEDKYTITWEEGCTPKVKGTLQSTPKYRTFYQVERFNEATGQWVTAASNGNPLPILGNHGASEAVVTTNTQGKFRVIRKIVNANGLADCIQVISEKEYKGNLQQPKIVNFRCVGNKYHVALVPKGGTPPYIYTLVSQQKTGETNPTILNRPGDDENFFLDIDGADTNTRYVFKVTDACNRAETVDWIVSNYQPLQIEADKTSYCNGQKATLSVPYLGSKIVIKWYRADNPTALLHTGTSYTINSLTNDDFDNKYIVKLESTHSANVNTCISANPIEYTFVRPANVPAPVAIQKHDIEKCISADPIDNTSYTTVFDLNDLFTDTNSNPLYIKKIEDKNGVIPVPANGKVNINTSTFVGKTNTFVYSILSSCGEVLTKVEATLKVKKPLLLQGVVTNINLCQPTATYQDIENLMFSAYGNGYNQIRNSGATFAWYETLANAEAQTNKKINTASIGTIAEGSSKNLYLRLTKEGYCPSSVYTIKVNKVATAAPAAKTLGNICVLTVGELKRLIDSANPSQIIIKQGGQALDDRHNILSTTGITYSKRLGECETAQAPVTFTLSGGQTQAQAQVLMMCTLVNNYGYSYALGSEVKNALKAIYPNAMANGIKIYNSTGSEYTDTDFVFTSNRHTFTVKENNKCVSQPYSFSIVEKAKASAPSATVSLCEDSTIADLKAKISGNNIKIYKGDTPQADSAPIDWDQITAYQYTLEETGKCPSNKAAIILNKSANATPAPAKTVSFCSVNPKVADLRAAIGDSSAKIYLKDGNRYDEQPDAAALNTTLTYYYTIQHTGKCISPKAVVSFGISAATLKGDYNKITTCPTTVAQLKAEIKAGEPGRRTEELKVYEGTADPPTSAPLADNTPITAEHYSYTYTQTGRCESPIRIADIIKPAVPTPQPTQTICGGTATVAALQPQGTTIRWYNVVTGGSPLSTTTALANGDYYVAQTNAGGTCESSRVKVTVTLVNLAKPTITVTAATCTSPSKAKITNYQTGATYWEGAIQLTVNASGEITTPLAVGTHSIIAKQDTCSSTASDSFTIAAQVAAPAAPTVVEKTAASCTAVSVAKVSNYASDVTYAITNNAGALVTGASVVADGTINGLTAAGNYKIKATKNGCASSEASFTIAAQVAAPAASTVTSRTECPTSVSTQFDMATLVTPATGHTLKWYDAATGGTALAASPKVERQVIAKVVTTKYVSQEKDGCESARIAVTYTIDDTQAPTLTVSDIVLDCSAANFDTLVANWLATAAATDTCTTPVITNNYTKPTDVCGAGEIVVTFTAKDSFGNQTQKIGKIRFIVAKDDDYTSTPVTPSSSVQVVKDGSGTPYNILTNDKLYGNGATTSNVTISEVTPNANVKIDTATGQVKVQPNTPAGTYTVTYRICDKNISTACSNIATVKVKVTSTIDAVDDPEVSVPRTGGTVSILTNDTLNGNPATTSNVTITVTNDGGLTGLTVDGTGKLVVPNNTTPGTYTITYKICDKANLNVCDSATAKIKVPSVIDAVDDPEVSVPRTGGTVSILTNDTLNGNPATTNNVTITVTNDGGLTGLTVDSTGKLVVPNNTTPGTYTITYKICDKLDANVCDSATAKIKVPSVIDAVDDPEVSVPRTGGTVSILTNDTLNGNPATTSNVTITVTNDGGLTGLTVDGTGKLVVPNNTTPNTYTVTYKICDKANSNVCDSATAKIKVPAVIDAVDDPEVSVPRTGGTVSILTNDTLNGNPATTSNVTITVTNDGGLTGLTVDSTGKLVVPNNTTPGTYTITYKICDKLDANVCDTATAKIKVPSVIDAVDDPEVSVPRTGGTVSILTNDTLNGNPATTSNVTITVTNDGGLTGLTVDGTGKLVVPNNTTPGTYTITYEICDKANSNVCDTATAKIKVPSVIDAVDDPEVSVPRTGGTVSILTNDTLNGNPATTSNVTITVTNDGGLTGLTVDGTGKLVVPNNTTPGTYTITYEICDKANPGVCDTAVVKIKVTGTTSTIDAVDDGEKTLPHTGGIVEVLTNDTLNGSPATKDNVTVAIDNNGGLTGLTVNGDGKLVVPNNTTPNTYTVTYKICDKANLGVCDTAVVKIKVTGSTSTIDAVDDGEKTLPRTGGIVEVLTNDTLNGSPATKDNVTVAIDNNGGLTGLTVNGDGKLVVPNNTTPNTYTVTYKICDKANLGVCDTAVVKITIVTGPVIDAVNDPDVTMPRTGGNINILSNDTLNGNPATKDNVRITIEDNDGLTVLMIDPDTGFLVVPNNAPVGVYMVTYKICAKANAGLCDTAKVRITITGGAPRYIEAIDDGVWEVGTQGEFLTPSILDNDRLGSKVGLVSSDVLIERTQGQPAPDNHLVMNDDGRITVRRGIAIGTYIYYYTIIDRANSNQTSSAKAIIKVVNFVAQQDEFEITNTKNTPKNTPSVITNDEIDGRKSPVIGTDVTLTPGTPSHPNLQMNPDGTITIAPNTPDGTYTYEYTICRVSAPGDCKTAKAIIELHPALEANDDDYSAHPVNPAQQPIVVGNVLDNDTLAGAKITDPTKVAITLIDNDGLSGVSFAPNGEITVPQGANEGTYRVRYNLCMAQQLSVCDDAVVTIVITKDKPLTIYNGVSSNSDGKNDGFTIEGIEAYPKNTLKIFNRWGVLVYEKEGYTNAEPFDGYSNGRSTVEQGKRLPQGTYYYILDYQDSVGQTHNHSGWLYLKKE